MTTSFFHIPALLLSAAVSLTSLSASAGVITSQAQLTTILGAGESVETFEGKAGVAGGQLHASGSINSSNSLWLTQAGVTYTSSGLYRNENGYYSLNSRTLGDSANARPLTITFTSPVTDFGFDLQGYRGYSQQGTVTVYDTANQLIATTSVNGGFFGWENTAGIGHVMVSSQNGYIMIDNLGFGTAAAAVPEPASLGLLALGLCGLVAARRRKV